MRKTIVFIFLCSESGSYLGQSDNWQMGSLPWRTGMINLDKLKLCPSYLLSAYFFGLHYGLQPSTHPFYMFKSLLGFLSFPAQT